MKIMANHRILITGGLGFIGSHLAIHFHTAGSEIAVIDNLSRPTPNLSKEYQKLPFNVSYLHQKYPSIPQYHDDIQNLPRMIEILTEFKPTYIIHTAGQTSAVDSIVRPFNDFQNNVNGTLTLLEAVKETKCHAHFMFISSNKVYGNHPMNGQVLEEESRYTPKQISQKKSQKKVQKKVPNGANVSCGIKEQELVLDGIRTPYGTAKLCAEHYIQEYSAIVGFHYGIFRLSCIYGPRQFGFEEQGWIAHFLIQTILKHPITIFGNGKQVRDILYITDLCELFQQYMDHPQIYPNYLLESPGQIFNVGGGETSNISLLELVAYIREIGLALPEINYEPWRVADQKYYVSNTQKIQTFLPWTPKTHPSQGIQHTAEWIKSHQEIFME